MDYLKVNKNIATNAKSQIIIILNKSEKKDIS